MDSPQGQKNKDNMIAAIEALLFIYGEPLPIKKIAKLLSKKSGAEAAVAETAVTEALKNLERDYALENRGLTLVFEDNRVELVTKPALGSLLHDLVKEEFDESLTPASLETLAIIAYGGLLPRAVIDYIRGVNSTFILRALLLRGLVERTTDPKRPQAYLYRPSFELLKHLGVSKKEDLPEYQKFREIVNKLTNN